jgi:hypothetical protein
MKFQQLLHAPFLLCDKSNKVVVFVTLWKAGFYVGRLSTYCHTHTHTHNGETKLMDVFGISNAGSKPIIICSNCKRHGPSTAQQPTYDHNMQAACSETNTLYPDESDHESPPRWQALRGWC